MGKKEDSHSTRMDIPESPCTLRLLLQRSRQWCVSNEAVIVELGLCSRCVLCRMGSECEVDVLSSRTSTHMQEQMQVWERSGMQCMRADSADSQALLIFDTCWETWAPANPIVAMTLRTRTPCKHIQSSLWLTPSREEWFPKESDHFIF